MSTTSVKHREFVSEPMSDKDVTALAGVGETFGKKLKAVGFDKVTSTCVVCGDILQAYTVLGQFLVLKKDRELFLDWMRAARRRITPAAATNASASGANSTCDTTANAHRPLAH